MDQKFHFYFAHRMTHLRSLYTYVHSLHHRNTDIEPFAGLCMHPVEHLFYFSCVAPALYFKVSVCVFCVFCTADMLCQILLMFTI